MKLVSILTQPRWFPYSKYTCESEMFTYNVKPQSSLSVLHPNIRSTLMKRIIFLLSIILVFLLLTYSTIYYSPDHQIRSMFFYPKVSLKGRPVQYFDQFVNQSYSTPYITISNFIPFSNFSFKSLNFVDQNKGKIRI